MNNIFLATYCGKHVLLVLLDLTAAFDTVDHGSLDYSYVWEFPAWPFVDKIISL